jgi:hypothetical protein
LWPPRCARGSRDPVAPQALEGSLFEHAQEVHLVGQRDLAHLVKKQGAVGGELEAALLQARGPGEGAGLVPEKLVGEQLAGEHPAIDRHEGPAAAVAQRVQQPGEDLLARAGLPRKQHRGVASGHLDGHAVEGAHGARPEQQPGLVHRGAGLGVGLQSLRQEFAAIGAWVHHLELPNEKTPLRTRSALSDMGWRRPGAHRGERQNPAAPPARNGKTPPVGRSLPHKRQVLAVYLLPTWRSSM